MRIRIFIRNNWFLIGVILAISLAKVKPEIGCHGGPLRPEITVKVGCVALIFLISGLSIKSAELTKAFMQFKVHLFIQLHTFVAFPLLMHLMKPFFLSLLQDKDMVAGLVTLGCMPPAVSSAVILTKSAGGNEPAAIFNSAFGSFSGVLLTPFLLFNLVGLEATVSSPTIFKHLSMTVLCPLVLGQTALLIIIYTTFCDTFNQSQGSVEDWNLFKLASVSFIVILTQIFVMMWSFALCSSNVFSDSFSSQDIACITFCTVHKSLTLGIPILQILYEGSPALSDVCLPLLVYHPIQIILGGMTVPSMKTFVEKRSMGHPHIC